MPPSRENPVQVETGPILDDHPPEHTASRGTPHARSVTRRQPHSSDHGSSGTPILGRITFPGESAEVPNARAWLRELISDRSGEVVGDVALCATETITNAILHSNSRKIGGTVTLLAREVPGRVRIEVIDNGSPDKKPHLIDSAAGNTVGSRGLLLVDELSAAWGSFVHATGCTVWFEVAADSVPYPQGKQRSTLFAADTPEDRAEHLDILRQSLGQLAPSLYARLVRTGPNHLPLLHIRPDHGRNIDVTVSDPPGDDAPPVFRLSFGHDLAPVTTPEMAAAKLLAILAGDIQPAPSITAPQAPVASPVAAPKGAR